MNNNEIVNNGATFNFNDIKYASPKVNNMGGKNVKILDKYTNEWLTISTPVMLSFGINDYVDPQTGIGNGKYEISQLFPNSEYENEETKLFLENLKMFENKIKQDALKYSKEWFGKIHKSPEVVDALWTPMLKYSKDQNTGEYNLNKPPYIRSKVSNYDGKWNCEIYSEDNDILFPDEENSSLSPLDLFPPKKKCNIATVLLCGGIWFTNGKFTVTWELAQAVRKTPRERLLGKRKCLINLKTSDIETLKKENFDDDNEEINENKKKLSEDSDVNKKLSEDSDNEEGDDTTVKTQDNKDNVPVSAEEIQTTTEPETKKKKIIKKKST